MKKFLDFTIFNFGESSHLSVRSIIYIAVYIIVLYIFYRWIKRLAKLSVRRGKMQTGQAYAITQISKYVLFTIFIVLAFSALHIKPEYLLALTPLLVGFGLGIQQVFNDLVSGLILLVEHSIRVSDVVEVDGIVAKVKDIGIRTSKIESRDGIIMIIPNHKLVSEKVINWSTDNHMTRFSIKVGVAYGSNVELVSKLLIETAWKHSKIKTNPSPEVMFKDFGESSLDFELFFWSSDLFPIEITKSELRFSIDASFRENNITIPFPQRDLYIKQGGMKNETSNLASPE